MSKTIKKTAKSQPAIVTAPEAEKYFLTTVGEEIAVHRFDRDKMAYVELNRMNLGVHAPKFFAACRTKSLRFFV